MRIWFNHWFSTAYHLINMIQSDNPGAFSIIGSSTNPLAIYKNACDEWYSEPDAIEADAYIEFCIQFCTEHEIDIFAPRRFLVDIVKSANRFESIGVKLFANLNDKMIEILDDKQQTYSYLDGYGLACIPQTFVATNIAEFVNAYKELKVNCSRVCYKLIKDEGARSFRVVDNRIETSSGLLERPGSKVTFATAQKILEQYDFAIPILIMPYLSGIEISVDCLKTSTGNIIIPRYKTNKRYSEVIFSESVIRKCERIMELLKLEMPFNIQFKMEADKLYLLEINPRMSGGLQLSCKASGINLPSIAINKLLGRNLIWQYPERKSQKVAHIETPICL